MLRELIAETDDEELCSELKSVRQRGIAMARELQAFTSMEMDDHTYWVEREGRSRKQTALHSAPVDVSHLLQDALFESVPSVVMTSATLAVHQSLDYFLQRVGGEEVHALQVGSPFDYQRQMRLHIPKGMPDPKDAEAYQDALAQAVLHYVARSRGRAFVLFTSAKTMRAVGRAVETGLKRSRIDLIVQGKGVSRHKMIEEFKRPGAKVLFGLDSFWMGVDVKGEALSCVMITRLPFSVPDHPVTAARMDRIRETGGDPFRDYSLPEAILKFRQGVGRLIRTASDEGIVVVLDNRITSRWYGRWFLESLPPCPIERDEIAFME